jgi:hypothetical protein
MATLREIVTERAGRRCEYCQAPQSVAGYVFHVEHIRPSSKGGAGELSNLALACVNCNFSKSNHTEGRDALSGKMQILFNPRQHRWSEHFRFSRKSLKITGTTAIGRATENRLQFNSSGQIEARAFWAELKIYP